MTDPAVPSGSRVFSTDNLRLAATLHAEHFPFSAHRHVSASGAGQQIAYFTFEATPALLAAAEAFYRGSLRVDVTQYEESKRAVYEAVNAALGRRNSK